MMHQLPRTVKVIVGFLWISLLALLLWMLFDVSPPTVQAELPTSCPTGVTVPISTAVLSNQAIETSLTKGGAAFSYSISLCSEPTQPVTVNLLTDAIASQELTITTPAAGYLVFTSANWHQPQTVTVQVHPNAPAEPDMQTAVISHSTTSGLGEYTRLSSELPYLRFTIVKKKPIAYLPQVFTYPTPTPTPTPKPTTPPPAANWSQIGATAGRDTDVVVIHQSQLYVGDRSNNPQKGIYRLATCATDAAYNPLFTGREVRDLAFIDNHGIASTTNHRVYRATAPWTQWTRTGSNMDDATYSVVFINATLAYAGADDGIYVSTDQGQSWDKVQPTGSGPTLFNAFRYDSTANQLWSLTYGGGPWKQTPGSKVFEQKIGGLPATDTDRRVWDLLVLAANEIVIATTNGVYKGDGNGDWVVFGLQGRQVLSLERVGGTLYAGVRDGGLWARPTNGATDWAQVTTPFNTASVRDLHYDQSGTCRNAAANRDALLAATNNGIWIYR
jgi:hypothetical protein